MTRRLSDWNLPPVVAGLQRLTHDDHGVRNARLLAQQAALIEHPAVVQRSVDGVDTRHALVKPIDDLASFGGLAPDADSSAGDAEPDAHASLDARGALWSTTENEAVKALLWVPNSVRVEGREHVLRPVAKHRAEVASLLLHETSDEQFRRARPSPQGKSSHETDLLERFVAALDAFDAVPSHSRGVDRTSAWPDSGEAEVGFADLLGTWRSETHSAWLLKDRHGNRSGTVPCFMIVEEVDGVPAVRWLYRDGRSVAVVLRLTRTASGRRLLCLYESDLEHTLTPRRPSHRGSCVLDIADDATLSPSAGDAHDTPADAPRARDSDRAGTVGAGGEVRLPRISGPYWTDRQSQGELRFDVRVDRVAPDFPTAQGFFD